MFDQAFRVVLVQALARSVLDTKSQVRSLERAAIEFQLAALPADGPQRLLPNALERELAESIRRTYSLVRRLVRVGTGLPRIDADERLGLTTLA